MSGLVCLEVVLSLVIGTFVYSCLPNQAVGETWDKVPELRFLALKRMYKYAVGQISMSCPPCTHASVLSP
jgi:hypothetical protein